MPKSRIDSIPRKAYFLTNNSAARDKINMIFSLQSFRYIIMNIRTYESHQLGLSMHNVNYFAAVSLNWVPGKMPQFNSMLLFVIQRDLSISPKD